ncbi:16S rRNA (cytosine(1402)-N(4))-methyltransferase RsmH [Mycolicibacillus parakoreensis]|nr:16S rRNA (cytosine(1402)-N(4))-methyltransferase RsmH [Mycolicibacillus parakoreensis]
MTRSATLSEAPARVAWPLPEPALTYFPNARSAISDRDLATGAGPRDHAEEPPAQPVRRVRRAGAAMTDTGSAADFGHLPVLAERCLQLLTPALADHPEGRGAVLVDATVGAGGHAEAFLTALPQLRLIGLDRDPGALRIAKDRLAPWGPQVSLVHARYDGIAEAVRRGGLAAPGSVHAVLFDLGVSSMQLDRVQRGFSYAHDAPLDMRMDPGLPLTAADILNDYERDEIADILHRYGEEKFARRIADRIVRQRKTTPFHTSGQLVELLYDAIPAPARRTGGHPAKRTFQALRIAVNDELEVLRRALPAALNLLAVAGRCAVLAYQSLEDRIVKQVFAAASASRTPLDLPVELPGHGAEFRSLTRGAERAGAAEIDHNPRSAAVRLRAVQRIAPPHQVMRRGEQ